MEIMCSGSGLLVSSLVIQHLMPPTAASRYVHLQSFFNSVVQLLQVQINGDVLTVDMAVNVSVNNPNYLSVDFSEIRADVRDPFPTILAEALNHWVALLSKQWYGYGHWRWGVETCRHPLEYPN